jgi:hypothetical protein
MDHMASRFSAIKEEMVYRGFKPSMDWPYSCGDASGEIAYAEFQHARQLLKERILLMLPKNAKWTNRVKPAWVPQTIGDDMKITYTADDGTEFDNEKDCLEHERNLPITVIWAEIVDSFFSNVNTGNRQSVDMGDALKDLLKTLVSKAALTHEAHIDAAEHGMPTGTYTADIGGLYNIEVDTKFITITEADKEYMGPEHDMDQPPSVTITQNEDRSMSLLLMNLGHKTSTTLVLKNGIWTFGSKSNINH